MPQKLIPDYHVSINRPLILYHSGHEQCDPSHSFGPAIRPHYLIHFILHGQGYYYVNGVTHHVKAGEGFLIYPGITTYYIADETDPWEYCWIGFDGYDVPMILKNCGLSQTSLVFTDHSNGSLWNSLIELEHNFTERKGNEMTYLGQLYLCFSHMIKETDTTSKPVYETHMLKALDYIQNNYTYDIKITDVAKHLSMDRTYLYKLFMTHIKVSPQQYLIRFRLDIAQKLLSETDLTVTEIAYSCGFRDASSFNKHFKNLLNITPTKYRTCSTSL
ncbi:MAG: AraC family transcriptional regulator [Herbinix sp.]|jgi:AraC-like DNA-binding protein|nr:AraC family transcriptional regulator [Herbinix sp.]